MAAQASNLSVQIKGLEGELLKSTQAYLNIYKESKADNTLSPARIRQLHKQSSEEIKRSLRPFGYYQSFVKKYLNQTEDGWSAAYEIETGKVIRIDQLEYSLTGEGANEKEFLGLVQAFPLQAGEPLIHATYSTAKNQMLKAALANGYLRAKFVQNEIQIDIEQYHARIHLVFETGPQFHFGEVRFVQIGEQLNEQFLYRYLPFQAGDPFKTSALLELQTGLSDSDHFTRIEIHQLFEEIDELQVPLEINLTPRKPRKYRFGLGYGTDSGARASAEHQRRVSPKGHVLTLKGKTSERINRVDMQYSMPLKKPASEQFSMTTHYLEQFTESRRTNAGALDFRVISGRKSWRQALAVTYEREDYRVSDETGSSQLLMPNADLIYNKFNDRLYPTKGVRLTTELWVSSELWLSDVDFIQLKFTGKWIYPVSNFGRLIAKFLAGGTLIKNVETLPASKRFYAGGDQSIRGYAYEELGPEDSEGAVFGGKYLGVVGLEYEHQIFTDWGLAIFYDAGNSFNDDFENIYRGVGVGLRWRSKVGPIRFDLGWPLDKTVEYPRIHLIIGLDL